MKPDLIHVVEAAYRSEPTVERWLSGVVSAARPLLDMGGGGFAALPTRTDDGAVRVGSIVADEALLDTARFVVDKSPRLSPADMAKTYLSPVLYGTMAERLGGARAYERHWLREEFRRRGFFDFETLVAFDPTGRGCVMAWARSEGWRTPRRTAAAWARISAHLLAGLRLQGSLADVAPDASSSTEAILRPDGEVIHAVGPARDARAAIRRAARAIDRARTSPKRKDAVETLEVWRGLVSGRWSLVDMFDTDGRRFVVAHRNDPAVRPTLALSLRERQVLAYVALGHSNKLIAYTLGLSTSTVAEHVRRAMLKVGLRSRLDVVKLFRGGQ